MHTFVVARAQIPIHVLHRSCLSSFHDKSCSMLHNFALLYSSLRVEPLRNVLLPICGKHLVSSLIAVPFCYAIGVLDILHVGERLWRVLPPPCISSPYIVPPMYTSRASGLLTLTTLDKQRQQEDSDVLRLEVSVNRTYYSHLSLK